MKKRGCLIFAHNNGTIDYERLAQKSAENIERHLGLPTAIVTGDPGAKGGNRWFADYGETVPWYNNKRSSAYLATPFEETILLDADYVVASNQLNRLFESDKDFLCHRTATSVTGANWNNQINYFGNYKFPMWWATVVYFRKSDTANAIFNAWHMVRENYKHYARLYNFKQQPFRNDFALSIALGIATGHHLTNEFDIPWDLASMVPEDRLELLDTDSYKVSYKNGERDMYLHINNMDFHAMGKKHLEEIYAD